MKTGVIYRQEQPIVPTAWRADQPWSRLRGLLGRPPLTERGRQALWLVPCGGVHTFGMAYALDIVFLDRKGQIIDWFERLEPWHMRHCTGAYQTVEFAAGSLGWLNPQQGETWQWRST